MSTPTVSILLPTYNRAAMLAEGLQSIASQEFEGWELVVVDDGSTDRNREVVEAFKRQVRQPVMYIYQENRGPGAARQRAIESSRGDLIAFMDSDDPWMPHHLSKSVGALRDNVDIDWISAPARVVSEVTGEQVFDNSFTRKGNPKLFLSLQREVRDDLSVVTAPNFAEHVIAHEFPGGLQASVMRRVVCDTVSFRPYRLYDDDAFRIEVAARGFRIGYFSDAHIIYRVHNENLSLVNPKNANFQKRIDAVNDGIAIHKELLLEEYFSPRERQALRNRLASLIFWNLGYSTYL